MITGVFIFDWALIFISLLNGLLMLWLSLTVMLSAEERTWGVWLVEEGLMLGSLFFFVHTIILGYQQTNWDIGELNFWWRIGWMPVILTPLAWYVVVLWFSGFFDRRDSDLFQRHRLWLAAMTLTGGGLAALVAAGHPLPSFTQTIALDLTATRTILGVPLLFAVFPPFAVLCILLSIDTLRRPEPSQRMMGDEARQRARPWLLATSLVLLTVGVLVSLFMAAAVFRARTGPLGIRTETGLLGIAALDLLLETMIAIAVIFLGQAVVSYEVFTGRSLPRRGFLRHWRNAIILSAGLAAFIAWSLIWQPLPVYSLLVLAGINVVFYALLTWRSFVHRDHLITRLRPLVARPPLADESYGRILFEIVCREMLTTQRAVLVPLSPLAGSPLCFPADQPVPRVPMELLATSTRPIPVDEPGFHWAVPLWAERGLSGALLLGDKMDGGLYTQEEIDAARATCERIVDLLARERMTQHLIQLQRQRTAETRIMDMRTRRILHDETLPSIHTTILSLSALARDHIPASEAIAALTESHQQISDLIHTTSSVSQHNGLADLAGLFRSTIEHEYAKSFDSLTWDLPDLPQIEPMAAEVLAGALREVVRNAAVHGRGDTPNRPLNVRVRAEVADNLTITVEDDGVGLDYPHSGSGGSGGGLILHSTLMTVAGGFLRLDPSTSGGVRVTLSLPLFTQQIIDF